MNTVTFEDDERPSIFHPAIDATCALPQRAATTVKGGRRTNKRKHRRNMTYRRRR